MCILDEGKSSALVNVDCLVVQVFVLSESVSCECA